MAIFGAWAGYEAFRRRAGRRLRTAAARCSCCGMIFLPRAPYSPHAPTSFPPPDRIPIKKSSPLLLDCPRCQARLEWVPPRHASPGTPSSEEAFSDS